MYSQIYLPATFNLKYVIKYAVYSTLNSKLMTSYCHRIDCFAFSSIHQLSFHRVNEGRYLMMGPEILLPLPC